MSAYAVTHTKIQHHLGEWRTGWVVDSSSTDPEVFHRFIHAASTDKHLQASVMQMCSEVASNCPAKLGVV
jgi:hypothetical protein